jgi:signal recognition particle subunit SEC65
MTAVIYLIGFDLKSRKEGRKEGRKQAGTHSPGGEARQRGEVR